MLHIADQTADRLVVRNFWDGRFEALQMFFTGLAYAIVASVFLVFVAGRVRWWVTVLVLLGGSALAVLFLWLGYSRRKRVSESLYVFDKRRGTFEICTRGQRESEFQVKSYPLAFVQGATVKQESDEDGWETALIIPLVDAMHVRFTWRGRSRTLPDKLKTAINDFLGTPEPQA
jgi:hypothetical protein